MGKDSGIQWTHHTFNPWIGCQRVSPGCEHCYAETYDKRVGGAMVAGEKRLRWGPTAPRVRTSPANWKKPFAWAAAASEAGERHRVFCASLADVFEDRHELRQWRFELFEVIRRTPSLDWLLLTKRPQNIRRLLGECCDAFVRTPGVTMETNDMLEAWLDGRPPKNVWLGCTVEDQQRADERIPALLAVPAAVRFLSCEPLLEEVSLWVPGVDSHLEWSVDSSQKIDWVIIGGESGGKARPFDVEWARSVLTQCRTAGIAPFVKQLGARPCETAENVRALVDYSGGEDLEEIIELATTNPAPPGWTRVSVAGVPGSKLRRWPRFADHHGGDPSEWPADLRVREFPMVTP